MAQGHRQVSRILLQARLAHLDPFRTETLCVECFLRERRVRCAARESAVRAVFSSPAVAPGARMRVERD